MVKQQAPALTPGQLERVSLFQVAATYAPRATPDEMVGIAEYLRLGVEVEDDDAAWVECEQATRESIDAARPGSVAYMADPDDDRSNLVYAKATNGLWHILLDDDIPAEVARIGYTLDEMVEKAEESEMHLHGDVEDFGLAQDDIDGDN